MEPEQAPIWTGAECYAEFGWIFAAANDRGLVRLAMQVDPVRAAARLPAGSPNPGPGARIVSETLFQLGEYFGRVRQSFSVPVDWLSMRPFQQQVLRLTAAIPYGEVRTYGEIARELGQLGAARAVGRALATNPIGIILPCHRVVGADGSLHGFSAAGGLATKAWLLALEGVCLEGDRVLLPGVQPVIPGLL